MSDRLKFRYWHTKENKYIYTQCDCLAIINTVLYSLISKPNRGGWYETEIEKAYNNFELIPEQCTGLKDKNGNLIYEGDIVEDMWGDALFIKWRDSEARFAAEDDNVVYDLEDIVDGCEIIGNIHEQEGQQ